MLDVELINWTNS